ncbi:hypothetical protein GCM10012280_23040 [Wenjunlia tyrosinilytica]|uniref:PAS domain S-box-containing protein n=1 Tax=Wenjunlia tyrosinilytica TaxID=1544741 RepID=A0A917ZMI6_9ACTN|nr:hypothetical protein GCM10012280_23040 [Wenjunlia tyrosinilytica]
MLVNCNGTVVNANAIALESFEAPGTALVGRGLLDLLPSFDSKRIPGSMRRADEQPAGRTRPTRMIARRTDGVEFLVEVTSANLEDGRTPYAQPDHYTGDELLMLVVRDLTGTLDTEAELARQQRQTEMILRAAAEGVVGVDTEGRVVLVNPSAAQILGYRASDLGGQELHPLIQHSRPDGTPLPVDESPLSDTLRSGRKHRVRGVVLWRKDGRSVPVDLTTAPVRDGDQLVGAVMTFTDRTQLDAVARRNDQLQAVLDSSLRGPLEELRSELAGLAADPAGQLWPEANQILHHLAAGYARITTLIDNVSSFQKLESGAEPLKRQTVGLDEVVAAGVEGAIELIGPGRAQYAVHAPPVEVSLDGQRMAQALAHLIADTIGVDATGTAGTGDSTIVVAAAQRGDVARIEVRGPQNGGHPVHLPLARGVVERHGGVLQVHEVPGGQGSAYVLEVPIGVEGDGGGGPGGGGPGGGDGNGQGGDGTNGGNAMSPGNETTVMPVPSEPMRGMARNEDSAAGTPQEITPQRPPRQRQASPESALALPAGPLPAGPLPAGPLPAGPAGRLMPVAAPALSAAANAQHARRNQQPQTGQPLEQSDQPTGRRRALRRTGENPGQGPGQGQSALPELPPAGGSASEVEHARADAGNAAQLQPASPGGTGRRARRALPEAAEPAVFPQQQSYEGDMSSLGQGVAFPQPNDGSNGGQNSLVPAPSGRRRKLAAPGERPEAAARLRQAQAQAAQAQARPEAPAAPAAPAAANPGGHASVPAPRESDTNGRGFAEPSGERGGASDSQGRAFTIGAPAEGAEGPEHLDELASCAEDEPDPRNPRRLLVWPEPDASTHRALVHRGYDPVVVRSREEVATHSNDSQAAAAAGPAALFVDPLTGPITRTALQSLRTAAVAAEVPVLVTAGLGQATREAAYGADPAVLLKALAPRDSQRHPPRVLLVEGHQDIAAAFTATLERRGMQVARAASDAEAVTVADQVQPNLVVMDLMLIRRRRVGIVDWMRANGQLNRTPLVVYTSVDIDPAELPRLRSGETVLFLAERSTSGEVQGRIVDLLGKIGARRPGR